MQRRQFLKNGLVLTVLARTSSIYSKNLLSGNTKKLTILHTNDVHSHIEPFPDNHSKNPNMGGVARRATLIEKIRNEEKNVLLVDAGDIFQGTPYFNYYGGELEFKLMSMMKYDVATIGNHDFDNGLEGLYKQLPHATFDFVSANYDFSNTILDGLIKPYKIIKKDGIKIGIFGLGVQLEGLVDKKLCKETKYLNPLEIANETAFYLKQHKKCNLVVCLSHLGFAYSNIPERISDVKLAQQSKNIDAIIGGHTHTFLEKPVIEYNLDNQPVVINQTGCFGINLGRLDFYFSEENTITNSGRNIELF